MPGPAPRKPAIAWRRSSSCWLAWAGIEAAEHRVAEIRQRPLSDAVRMRAIDVLVENAAGYPHEAVRAVAADATRTIVARHLREVTGPELDHSLDALRRLVPADRLLERDTARYFRNRTQVPPRTKAKPPARPVVPQPHIAMELKRLESMSWTARCNGSVPSRAEIISMRPGFRIACCGWLQCHLERPVQAEVARLSEIGRPILLSGMIRWRQEVVVLHLGRGPPVPSITFVASDVDPSIVATPACRLVA